MSNEELIARLSVAMEAFDVDTLGDDPVVFDEWRLLHDARAALEAQSAPLVADSRQKLAQALEDAMSNWEVDLYPGKDFGEAQADALFEWGLVSLAADRDRATAEAFGLWLLDIGHMPDLGRVNMKQLAAQFANPYRESTERCPMCRCQLAYPTALHVVDCVGFDRESEGKR